MKAKTILLIVAACSLFFMGCNDSKKKEAGAQAQAEQRMQQEQDSIMRLQDENNARMEEIENNSITAKVMGNADYSTLAKDLQSADMAETLKGEGEYTVFAPTDEAFDKVPKATLDNWMKPENKEQLQKLLKYHVVQGKMDVAQLSTKIKEAGGKLDLTTLNGEIITLSEKDGNVMIKDAKGNTATVTDPDTAASNGVIHQIDKVLMPKK